MKQCISVNSWLKNWYILEHYHCKKCIWFQWDLSSELLISGLEFKSHWNHIHCVLLCLRICKWKSLRIFKCNIILHWTDKGYYRQWSGPLVRYSMTGRRCETSSPRSVHCNMIENSILISFLEHILKNISWYILFYYTGMISHICSNLIPDEVWNVLYSFNISFLCIDLKKFNHNIKIMLIFFSY